MKVSRRLFLKASASTLGATSLAALGFAPAPVLAQVREFKLAHARETRNTCPYCSVGCGLLMYSLGDGAKNAKSKLMHIEGDPDHPVSRGTLCPKGASLIDFVNSPHRLLWPERRAPGGTAFERVTWEYALDRIARLMKADRDAGFVEQNAQGVTVNRWPTFGVLAASASSNESGYLTHKAFRSMGVVAIDNQARV
jgi:formate dehydrogenase major subunit